MKKRVPTFSFLIKEFNISMREAQRWVDRYRVYEEGKCIAQKNHQLYGNIDIIVYEPNPKGLKPIFYEEDFVVYDKPSGVLVHPTSRQCKYSLKDEILHEFGKDAHVAHRLDRQTSGLILVAKDKKSESKLKKLFELRQVKKTYLALSKGKIKSPLHVDASLLNNQEYGELKLRMVVHPKGKNAITDIFPLFYFDDIDATLVKVIPKTGRQHQIRVHLFHVKHPIIGDPIYGANSATTSAYLDGKLSKEEQVKYFGASRLLLHADGLDFIYDEKRYTFKSPVDSQKEFYTYAKENKNEIRSL